MTDVSVIGLGAMGSALARALVNGGYRVTVWNRTAERAAPLVDAGAVLAPSAVAAIEASPVTVVCIRSHSDTRALLGAEPSALAGHIVVELSTGEASEAEALVDWVNAQGAECLIGMIATFPGDIGKPESAIVTVGKESVWQRCEPILKTMAGKSSYIGPNVGALAALFAGLFLPRQGFMFGMIYGALICAKAGISMDDYVAQIPLTLKVVHDYYDVFAGSVPSGNFADPPASMATYLAAFEDVVDTFQKMGVTRELPQLLHDLAKRGVDAGLGDQQITALVNLLKA